MSKRSKQKVTLKASHSRPDWILIGLVFSLVVFGLIMIADVSVAEALRDFNDKFYYFRLQLRWAGLGMFAFLGTSLFDYRRLKILAIPLIVLTIVCLGLVLVPGIGITALGAKRWLGIGSLNFQPAELAKLASIIYLSAYLTGKKKFLPFLVVLGLLAGLVILEPDLGTTVVLVATSFAVYFASGAPVILLGTLALIGLGAGIGLIFLSPYRKERFLTFLNPSRDPLGASYHVRQILLAIGSGGLFGLGLGRSRQKFEYLPAATTDSVFAIIAEEIGFIGSVILIALFLTLVWRGLRIAREAPDDFGRLLAVGITSWIAFQTITNLAAMVALIPLTGVPLPFISYGGSSLVLTLTGMGILVNISRKRIIKK
jgi:cell division protein FtsW